MGMFHPLSRHSEIKLVGVEAGGLGLASGKHGATLSGGGRPGVLHGSLSYLLQDRDGQVFEAHSISAGLDYPGVGPEHSHFKETGRAEYVAVTDQEALEGMTLLSRTEGIIPALESSHAVYQAAQMAPSMGADQIIVVCLSGRGDKDMAEVSRALGGLGQ